MKRFLKYAWALATLALLGAGFYNWYYWLAAAASGSFWYWVYYYDKEYA